MDHDSDTSGELVAAPLGICAQAATPPDFDPVILRLRSDGWTVDRQRAFLEALADCGIIRHAAAVVGMSEQSVTRLRRRAGATSFDQACDAALRIGSRRLRSIAFERAVEGQVKRHYFHGELVSEEIVHDNRLLICLLGKFGGLFTDSAATVKAERHWDAHLATLVGEDMLAADASGKPKIAIQPLGRARAFDDEIWREPDGEWMTSLPPPDGFDGKQDGCPGEEIYRRRLSERELAIVEARMQQEIDGEAARRQRFFDSSGRTSPGAPRSAFSLQGPEPSTPSSVPNGGTRPLPARTPG